MPTSSQTALLDEQIEHWRTYLRRRQTNESIDIAELENHLRAHIERLLTAGLAADEAFLVAVRRTGASDARSREFAHEHSNRLWKQLVLAPADSGVLRGSSRPDAIVAFCLAVAAAVAIKVPALFGLRLNEDGDFYGRNLSLFVLPLLTAYFIWKRRPDARTVYWLSAAFVASCVFINVYPFVSDGSTEVLAALHLPIALWLFVGIAHAGGRWGEVAGRMNFIRFSGELFIYYVLIALGGGVLMALMSMIFKTIGIEVDSFAESWLLPCGAAGAVIVAAWLVEAKQSVIENMAPVLTRLFTPAFAAVLIAFLAALLWTGRGIDIDREVLISFDLLLALVIGLLLYSVSARDPLSPPNTFDVVQIALVVGALLADSVALWAIAVRITEYGFTPNRVAALGENVIFLVNLTWSAVLHVRFLRGRGAFSKIEKWQTDYLPVYAAWAAVIVIAFPPLFGYG